MDGHERTLPVREVDLRPAHWLMALLTVVTGAIHVYMGATTGETAFLVFGAILFAGLAVFFTPYWRPPLYVVGMLYVGFLIVAWVVSGMGFFRIGLADTAVKAALILVFVYLLYTEAGGSAPTE